jgi:hypothetical protein
MVDRLVDHPSKTITMVVPFAATAAWLWRISHPYSRKPEGVGRGWYSRILLNSADQPRKKVND